MPVPPVRLSVTVLVLVEPLVLTVVVIVWPEVKVMVVPWAVAFHPLPSPMANTSSLGSEPG